MGLVFREPLKHLLPFAVLCVSTATHGQAGKPFYEFGLGLGRLVYQGDLTPSVTGSFRTSRTSFGISVSRMVGSSFSIRGSFLHGGLAGNDAAYSSPAFRKERAFRFSSPVNELTGQLVWAFPGVPRYEKGFTPYVFAGAGLAILRVQPDASAFNTEYFGSEATQISQGLADDAAHGTPSLLPLAMTGVGIKYFFHPNWGVNAETSYRMTFSDYIDGFSQSVNPALNDHYMNHSIGLLYRPGKKGGALECPRVRY